MRFSIQSLVLLTLSSSTLQRAIAFTSSSREHSRGGRSIVSSPLWNPSLVGRPYEDVIVTSLSATTTATDEDCGCAPSKPSTTTTTIYSGRPSQLARTSINPREAIRKGNVYNIHGKASNMDDLIVGTSESSLSVVVFLRSLGWPLCQEFIVQWCRRMEELNEMGVTLVLVSIGKPEIAKNLVEHLDIPNGEVYLYVDPDNTLYDALGLNKGVRETFFSPSTPMAFLDRLTKPDGMADLMGVLSKWNKGRFVWMQT